MHEDDVSAGRLNAAMFALMRDNAAAVALSIIAMSTVGVAAEMVNPEAYFSLPVSIASMLAQFIVMRAALDRMGLVQRSGRAVGAYIGASILINIGVLLGLVLLIIPGVVLTLRWSIALPILLAEDQDASGSLSESWARTRGHALQILLAYLVPLAALVCAILAYATADPETAQVSMTASAIGNALMSLFSVMTWLLSVALYAAVTGAHEPLEEIFA
jgi:hypothetical protein